MRQIKQIGLVVVLTLTLGTGAMAGIISTPPEPPPPPPSESVTAAGIIEMPPAPQATNAPDNSVIELTLSVLRSVLSVL